MSALNPNHPVSQAISDHWHKVVAIMMNKLGYTHFVITEKDILAMPPDSCITVQELGDGMHLRVVGKDEAIRLAKTHGGLPK